MALAEPRDPAVDAILTAESLVVQLSASLRRMNAGGMTADRTLAESEAQMMYPAIWSSLDTARKHLGRRGVDLAAYDVLRARQPTSMVANEVGRDAANRAMDLLRGAMPEVAWTELRAASEKKVRTQRDAASVQKWVRLGFAVATLALLIAGVYMVMTGMKR